jgi:hypothetical protein
MKTVLNTGPAIADGSPPRLGYRQEGNGLPNSRFKRMR